MTHKLVLKGGLSADRSIMSRRYFKQGDAMSKKDKSDSSSEEENDPVHSLLPSTYRSSLFSSNRTYDTHSSAPTSSSPQPKGFLSSIDSIGKPLRVMAADKYTELSRTGTIQSTASSFSSRRRRSELSETMEFARDDIVKELDVLSESLLELVDSVNQSVLDVSKATIRIVELLDDSIKRYHPFDGFEGLKSIQDANKVCLQFHDTFLRYNAYEDSRRLLLRSFTEFLKRLGCKMNVDQHDPVPYYHNFAILDRDSPQLSKVKLIMDRLESSSSVISDQQGSFIAPILRGLTRSTSVLSIMFGFPEPQQGHYDVINALFQTFPDLHFFVIKNCIKPAGTKFHPPFRVPNSRKPAISISVSSTNSIKSSGTLGGYIAPRITGSTDRSLLKYKGAKFALTCAHVLLSEDQDYPHVTVPSSVILNKYKSALRDERDRYKLGSVEYESYERELSTVDLCSVDLGQVVWGERIVTKSKLSDVAIVKLSDELTVENNLGDDVDSYNPALKFENTKIKRVIPKKSFGKHCNVFKIGATTKYTTGELNGLRLVYWLDGSLQTSEFVVSSYETFASGGDSGSLILHDLEREQGLGVLGMLHSYDGERREIGLFTPMEDVLGRLEEVTGVEWGFV